MKFNNINELYEAVFNSLKDVPDIVTELKSNYISIEKQDEKLYLLITGFRSSEEYCFCLDLKDSHHPRVKLNKLADTEIELIHRKLFNTVTALKSFKEILTVLNSFHGATIKTINSSIVNAKESPEFSEFINQICIHTGMSRFIESSVHETQYNEIILNLNKMHIYLEVDRRSSLIRFRDTRTYISSGDSARYEAKRLIMVADLFDLINRLQNGVINNPSKCGESNEII